MVSYHTCMHTYHIISRLCVHESMYVPLIQSPSIQIPAIPDAFIHQHDTPHLHVHHPSTPDLSIIISYPRPYARQTHMARVHTHHTNVHIPSSQTHPAEKTHTPKTHCTIHKKHNQHAFHTLHCNTSLHNTHLYPTLPYQSSKSPSKQNARTNIYKRNQIHTQTDTNTHILTGNARTQYQNPHPAQAKTHTTTQSKQHHTQQLQITHTSKAHIIISCTAPCPPTSHTPYVRTRYRHMHVRISRMHTIKHETKHENMLAIPCHSRIPPKQLRYSPHCQAAAHKHHSDPPDSH